jgi:hypothetical protein
MNQTNFSNQNVNFISNSSSSSSLNENEFKSGATTMLPGDLINNNEYTIENEKEIEHYLRMQQQNSTALSRSNSARVVSVTGGTAARNQLSNITTSSSSSVTNLKRSTTYNNGSNVHEDSTMYFYGSKSSKFHLPIFLNFQVLEFFIYKLKKKLSGHFRE